MRNIMFPNMLLVNYIYVTNRTQFNPVYKGINVNLIDLFIKGSLVNIAHLLYILISQLSANILPQLAHDVIRTLVKR